MTGRRSRLEIVLKILSTVESGTDKPTRIMYNTGLSWKPTMILLSSLVEKGYLRKREVPAASRSRRRYEVTDKGIRVLRYFEEAGELIGIIETPSVD